MSTTVEGTLLGIGACHDAIEWARELSPQIAWRECDRGDWLLWLLGRVDDRKTVVRLACKCARLALPHAKSAASLVAIETTERWANCEATIDEVREARAADSSAADSAAAATAVAAYAADSAVAAYAAATAAAAAADSAAAYAADSAADYAVAAYAADSAYAYAREQTLKQCAEIVREVYPDVPGCVLALLNGD